MNREVCHDCGVLEGELHLPECDMETCSKCGGQLLGCGCIMSNDKDRIPWIQYPNICQKCGKLWPDLFTVPDDEWEYYIEPRMRDKVICRECYDFIKKVIGEEGNRMNRVCPSCDSYIMRLTDKEGNFARYLCSSCRWTSTDEEYKFRDKEVR